MSKKKTVASGELIRIFSAFADKSERQDTAKKEDEMDEAKEKMTEQQEGRRSKVVAWIRENRNLVSSYRTHTNTHATHTVCHSPIACLSRLCPPLIGNVNWDDPRGGSTVTVGWMAQWWTLEEEISDREARDALTVDCSKDRENRGLLLSDAFITPLFFSRSGAFLRTAGLKMMPRRGTDRWWQPWWIASLGLRNAMGSMVPPNAPGSDQSLESEAS